MKKYISLLVVALFTLVFAGCSTHSPAATARPAIDLVQAGKDIVFPGGYVLRVEKREGNSLEGIHVHITPADGQIREITAGTGTIKSGTEEHPEFANQITMTLHNAKIVSGSTNYTSASVIIVLYRPI